MTGLTPEAALLFATAGPADQDDRIRRLAGADLRWDHLLWLAVRERVVPVVWRRLEALALPMPRDVQEAFRRQTMVAAFAAARIETGLATLLEALHREGIEPVLLKGAALASTVYPGFRDRPMCDLDVLVRPEDGPRSRDIALAAGWLPVEAYEAADYGRHHHLAPLIDPTGVVGLELHTDLFPAGSPFGGFAQAVHRRSEPHPSGFGRVPLPVHATMHLCLHLAWSHTMQFGGWRAFRDLHHLVVDGRVDWEDFRLEAGRMGATSCCYWVLRLARDLSGVSTPETDLAGLRHPGTSLEQVVLARHFAAGLDLPGRRCPSLALQRALWRRAIRPKRSGHGSSLPWSESVDVEGDVEMEHPDGARPGRLKHLVAVGRYLGGLLAPV